MKTMHIFYIVPEIDLCFWGFFHVGRMVNCLHVKYQYLVCVCSSFLVGGLPFMEK